MIMKMETEKKHYLAPQCEVLAVQCEGVIALSGGKYPEWPSQDW